MSAGPDTIFRLEVARAIHLHVRASDVEDQDLHDTTASRHGAASMNFRYSRSIMGSHERAPAMSAAKSSAR